MTKIALSGARSGIVHGDMNVGGTSVRDATPDYARSPEVAQAYLASIVDSTDDAIVSKNLDGIIQTWNRGAERIFGYTAEETIGKSILMLLPQERYPEEDMILGKIRRNERVEHFETQRRTKDGRLIDVSVTISPVLDASGVVIGASKIARDITYRVREATDRARLAAIIDSSDDAIISKDLNGIVQTWNGGAERIFGYMAEEMIGQSILAILPPDRYDEETRILNRLRRGERIDHYETARRRKDGRLVDVSVTISPIRDASGRIVGASKVARDISDRKVLEATMIRLREELEERVRERTSALESAHREMEAFTHSVSHDLRGPLRSIASTSAILLEDYVDRLPVEAQEMLQRQLRSSKYLAQLIEDLLKYSRIGQAAMNVVDFDFSEVANEIAADLRNTYPNIGFRVQEGMRATGDRSLLRLLAQNLMENGAKFSKGDGLVEVGKQADTFFVRDQGVGFEMLYADKIFQPFERLVRQDEFAGTGIGLANVRRIIERHGGAIWVHSNPGEGTTFFFTLSSVPGSRPFGR